MDNSKMLILGAGKYQRVPGATHVDRLPFPGIDKTRDLDIHNWALETNYYTHISAIHVVEHLDSLINFMDNCHDLLTQGGTLYIETPEAGGDPDLEFADPTHVRCYRPYSFINYFTPEGIEKFGYTNKAWAFYRAEARQSIVYIHCSPIK